MPSRKNLLTQLNNTGLQNKDSGLYQFLAQLLKGDDSSSGSGGGSSGGGSTVINNITNQNTIQQITFGDGDGGGEGDVGPPGPPGASGSDGANGMVPYFIATGETFTVPLYKQALFSMNIDNEGTLEVDGFLIEVD